MKKIFTAQQLQRMKDAYLISGKTLEKLSVDFGVSIPTVTKNLRAMGVTIRKVGRPRKHPLPVEPAAEVEPTPLKPAEREVTIFDW